MKINNKNILTLIASALLLFAVKDGLPYGYFTILRFVVCAITTYLAYTAYEKNSESLWVWAFGFIAILFNPLIPIYLQRSQWGPIDLIAGLFLISSMLFFKIKKGS